MTAPPTNTYETYAAVGNREDLSNIIYNIDPTDTPFLSGIPDVSAEAVLHSWQTDALDAASSTNYVEEGLDAETDAVTATVRLSNTCQISDKVPRVSGTQQAVNKAGRGDELEYQIAKMAKALKRDMETMLLANNAEVTGSSGTPRELGSVQAWITSNESGGTGSVASTGLGDNARTAASAGNRRAFTEALLKTELKSIWDNGGDPDMLMVGGFNKQQVSTFTGNATRQVNADDRKLFSTIDVYESDFGSLQVVPNRFMDQTMAFIAQMDLWAVAYLRPFQLYDLAKTGDSERRQLLAEYTLESRNEKGSGAVYDLTTS